MRALIHSFGTNRVGIRTAAVVWLAMLAINLVLAIAKQARFVVHSPRLLFPVAIFAFACIAGVPAWAGCPATVNLTVPAGGSVDISCAHDWGFLEVDTATTKTTTYGHVSVIPGQVYAPAYYNDSGAGQTDSFYLTDGQTGTGIGDPNAQVHLIVTIGAATSPITVAPSTLTAPAVGVPYSQQLTASGGVGSYTYSITGGTLPPGLTMSAGGLISGTSKGAQNYSFTVHVVDSATPTANTVDKIYSVNIANPVLVLSPTTPPDGAINTSYSQQLNVSGGTAPYTFSIEPGFGTPPPGISLSATGVLSGTPTATGSYTFRVKYQDSTTNQNSAVFFQTSDITLTITALPPPVANPVSATVAYGSSNNAIPLNISGSAPTSVAVGTPAGHGTATASGTSITYSPTPGYAGPDSFTYTATNAGGTSAPATVSITVSPPIITMSPAASALPGGSVGSPYTQTFTASGGSGSYTYAQTVGALPPGLVLASGVISGTPTATGIYNFTITATDSSTGPNAPFSTSQSYSITVAGVPGAPTIGTASAVDGQATVTFQPPASNGGATITGYTATSNPDNKTGTCAASPCTVMGLTNGTAYTFTVSATNSVGPGPSSAASNSVTPKAPQTITFANPGTQNFGTSPTLSATTTAGLQVQFTSSTTSVCTITQTGQLTTLAPGSCTINANQPGDAAVLPAPMVSQSFQIAVPGGAVSIITTALPGATAGILYSQTIAATGGAMPYTFTLTSGTLPNGLTLSPQGALAGTPTVSGSFPITVRVTDAATQTADQSYTLVIAAPTIAINPTTLPGGTGGTAYSQSLTASGGTAPYSYAVTVGGLPTGLTLSPAGTISGTPTVAGSFNITVTATDALGFTSSRAYALTISTPTITINPTSLPSGTGGTAYSQTLSATGGTGPYSYTVTAGALPAGLTLSPAGAISGTPTVSGTFNLTTTATDALNFTGSQAYTLVLSAPVPVARDMSVDLLAGTSATVDLTAGATGGPFTAAAIVTAPAAADGTASINGNNGTYELAFASSATASGAIAISYSLSNKWGVSAPATVTFHVKARPDPSKDPEVIGLINAQADSARRFAAAQISNFNGRLEQLHNEGDRRANSLDIQVGMTKPDDTGEPLGYAEDDPGADRSSASFGFPTSRFPTGGSSTGNSPDKRKPSESETSSPMAFWAGGFVNFGQRDNGTIDLKQTLAGVSGGVDYRFSPRFVGGVGFGYGRDAVDVGQNGTQSNGQAISVAAYGSYSPLANVFLDGLLGYSRLDFDSHRFVTDTGDFADGARGGQQVFGSLTAGYEYRKDGWLLSPYGRLEASQSRLDAFTEAGAGPYNLTFGAQSLSTVSGVLGLRAEYAMPMSWGVLTPRARLEYTHDFAGSSRASMGYADLSNGLPYGFDVDAFSRDSLGIGLGFDASFANGWLLGLDYATALGTDGNSQDHTVAVKVGARF